jgi:hypothetical protein
MPEAPVAVVGSPRWRNLMWEGIRTLQLTIDGGHTRKDSPKLIEQLADPGKPRLV